MLMKIDKTRLLKYIDDKYNNDDTKLFLKADINFCKDIIKKKKQADEIVTILYQRIEKNNKEKTKWIQTLLFMQQMMDKIDDQKTLDFYDDKSIETSRVIHNIDKQNDVISCICAVINLQQDTNQLFLKIHFKEEEA